MRNFLFFSILFFAINIFSQTGKIFTELNYNTFSHSSLSSFQQELVDDVLFEIDVPIMTTDDFPGNIGFSLGYEIVDQNLAFFIGYNSTGAKSSYADFSGRISIEQQLSATSFGGMYLIKLDEEDRFKLVLKAFGMYSSLGVETSFEITDFTSVVDDLGFSSFDVSVGASFMYEYPIASFLNLRASVGFDLVLGSQLNFDDFNNAHLLDNSGGKVKTNWSGLRTGIGVVFPINY